jgi:hypothetical protein
LVRTALLGAFLVASPFVGAGHAVAAPILDNEASYCELLAATGHIGNCGTLVSYGQGVCYQFDDGYGWYEILSNLDSAVGEADSAAILVTAVSELCPWHESKTP